MSIVAANVSANTSGSAINATGGSSKGQAVGSTAPAFNQSLLQLLLSGTATEQINADSVSGLAQLMSSLTSAENTVEEIPEEIKAIGDLLQGIDSLDDAIEQDPSLMGLLQGWIQQVMNFLQPSSANNAEDKTAVLKLAEQPETLRFAVQDTLTQLLGKLGKEQGNKNFKETSKQLVQALQHLVSGTELSKSFDATGTSNGTPSDVRTVTGQSLDQLVQDSGKQLSAETTASVTANEDQPDDHLFSGSIVTAGQLQLKDSSATMTVRTPIQVPVERFSQEMEKFVVNKLEIVKLQGMTEAKISLTPEHLGQVDVKISLHNGMIVAQFVTEHAFAKDSLEQQMAQLRTALQTQGLQVDKIEVTQNSSLSSHMYQDGRQPGSSGSQQRQNGKKQSVKDDEGLATIETLEDWNEWVREARNNDDGYGSSFTAKV
ncbi:flagellar hook-length control protein FliK [Paenibacillus sp. CAA11]|uniref:flagellar hook-length control protein FliK n=1 Tax=Paenibacillus sp. CAA11 TaxID=1532905 RepID=UPI001F4732BE|nr:flagellar hook-length control protein FliK [Paenibacillus sp. CAA11]